MLGLSRRACNTRLYTTHTHTAYHSPYKYARGGFSLPLENYCRRLHDLTLEYAQALGGDDTSYVPSYLDEECAAVVVREKGAGE